MASRYGITAVRLLRTALNLQIGAGIADRMESEDATEFIEEAEDWADSQVEQYLSVPLQPVVAQGDSSIPSPPTVRNFDHDFIQAITYYAVARIIQSEFSENSPNASESGEWCEEVAFTHILRFRSKRFKRVGAGRYRHPNPFMPPNIAPPEEDLANPRNT